MAVKQENCGLRGQQYAADVSAFNPRPLFSLNFGIFDHGWRRQPGAQQSTPFENVFLSSSNVATVGETVGETVGWSFWHALGGGVKGEPERQGENISTKGTGQLKTFFRELPVKTWSLRGCKDDFIIGQTWCGSGDKWLLVLSDVLKSRKIHIRPFPLFRGLTFLTLTVAAARLWVAFVASSHRGLFTYTEGENTRLTTYKSLTKLCQRICFKLKLL